MFTKRLTFIEFIERIEDLELVERFSERRQELCGIKLDDLTQVSYQKLKHEIPELIKQTKFEEAIFEILKTGSAEISLRKVKHADNYEKLKFFFWVQDQYKLIEQLERQYLQNPPDQKLVNAGIRELDILGDVNMIDMLANGDVLKWESIRHLPYATIFDKQLKIAIDSRINKRLAKQQ